MKVIIRADDQITVVVVDDQRIVLVETVSGPDMANAIVKACKGLVYDELCVVVVPTFDKEDEVEYTEVDTIKFSETRVQPYYMLKNDIDILIAIAQQLEAKRLLVYNSFRYYQTLTAGSGVVLDTLGKEYIVSAIADNRLVTSNVTTSAGVIEGIRSMANIVRSNKVVSVYSSPPWDYINMEDIPATKKSVLFFLNVPDVVQPTYEYQVDTNKVLLHGYKPEEIKYAELTVFQREEIIEKTSHRIPLEVKTDYINISALRAVSLIMMGIMVSIFVFSKIALQKDILVLEDSIVRENQMFSKIDMNRHFYLNLIDSLDNPYTSSDVYNAVADALEYGDILTFEYDTVTTLTEITVGYEHLSVKDASETSLRSLGLLPVEDVTVRYVDVGYSNVTRYSTERSVGN